MKSRKKINETEITLQKNFKKLRGTIPNNLILKDDIEKKIKKIELLEIETEKKNKFKMNKNNEPSQLAKYAT